MALETCELTAFLATTRAEESRRFYCDVLGLRFEEDGPFALVVKGVNATVRIQKVKSFVPLSFTAMGWRVEDVKAMARELVGKGVKFERFDGMGQDELGIWDSPSGARVCWFKDPDGNVLSLTQFA